MPGLKSINASFAEMHENYYTYEWTWAYNKIQEFYGLNPETVTAQDVVTIVKAWQKAVVGLDKMVYEDAKKEFSLSSMTGFGVDGSRDDMKQDFEQVRGDFESNTFVTAVLKHIEDKTALGNELIKRIDERWTLYNKVQFVHRLHLYLVILRYSFLILLLSFLILHS